MCFCVKVTSSRSHPVLVVLLCCAAAPATRLILRLLTPCKKRQTAAAIRGQRRRWGQIQRLGPLSAAVCEICWSDRTWQRDLRELGQTLLTQATHCKLHFVKCVCRCLCVRVYGSLKVNYLKCTGKKRRLLPNFIEGDEQIHFPLEGLVRFN